MPRPGPHRLTALKVRNERKPGLYSDGHGLYLQVTIGTDGAPRKSWLVRGRINGKVREMGLGSAEYVDLAKARTKADAARRVAADGVDPIEQRKQARQAEAPPP